VSAKRFMQAGPGLKLLFSYYNYFLFCFTGVIFSIPIMIFKCFNVIRDLPKRFPHRALY